MAAPSSTPSSSNIGILETAEDIQIRREQVLDRYDHFKQAVKWAIISLGVFIVPDIYIFFGTRELPKTVIVVLCLIIGATLAIGVFSVVRKIKKGRAERRLASGPTSDAPT